MLNMLQEIQVRSLNDSGIAASIIGVYDNKFVLTVYDLEEPGKKILSVATWKDEDIEVIKDIYDNGYKGLLLP